MKKFTAVLCGALLFIAANTSLAQTDFAKGDVLLNLGVGSSYRYAGGVPVIVSAEFGVSEFITVGPYLGFASYSYNTLGYRWNYTFLDLGARGSYHWGKHLNLGTDKLDLYGTLLLGFVVASYDVEPNINNVPGFNDPYGSTLRGGLSAGARWFFTDGFAANLELGVIGGVAPATLGVTFRF